MRYEVIRPNNHVLGWFGSLSKAKQFAKAEGWHTGDRPPKWEEAKSGDGSTQWWARSCDVGIRKSQSDLSSRDKSRARATDRPWRVRDSLTRHRYYFETRHEALAFVDSVSTSEITGEPLSRWRKRLIVEKNQ